jgi:hypothetical protein
LSGTLEWDSALVAVRVDAREILAKTPPIMKLLQKGFCMGKTITVGPTGVISIAVLAGIGAGVVLREGLKLINSSKIVEK